ncbi:MAG: glycoside hydrolase family 38 N-terminal domain-containing protein [Planctomycetota bacterium]|jgi:alpha-mannosidase
MKKLTVHMIGNAHLDPVWLWTWPSGVDEALATCRTACDLLDAYPDLRITRGEAWAHAQVEKLDPVLFARIRKHVAEDRWGCVNGWWVQPDCNLPTAAGFRKQGEIGKRFFREHLGVDVTVGYNVDSFGHAAMIPTFLREAGMDSYVWRRPEAHELDLPGDLFTWRSPAGDAVTAFRLCGGYLSDTLDELKGKLPEAVDRANRDAGHTMCFYGVGDHGGGPTREQVEWIREHAQYRDGVELVFSHPKLFFDAVAASGVELPVVTGELQLHAVGCYTAVHMIKQEVRRAETLAVQAERLAGTGERLSKAWERILFNQFHDILAGTSIAPAYEHARDELGLAKTVAREILVDAVRARTVRLEPRPHQRMLAVNVSDRPFRGYVEADPWLGFKAHKKTLSLTDADGKRVPLQVLDGDAAYFSPVRLLFPLELDAMEEKVLEIHEEEASPPAATVHVEDATLSNGMLALNLSETGFTFRDRTGSVRIAAFEDPTDTWSHGMLGYEGKEAGAFSSDRPWAVLEKGPLRMTMVNTFALGASTLLWKVFLQEGEPVVRMRLRLCWQGAGRVVKLIVPAAFRPERRRDGSPGCAIERPMDGNEWPMHDHVALSGKDGAIAVVSADTFGADVRPDGTIRVTLLRTPRYAHHDPYKLPEVHAYPATDQGVHEYEIAILPSSSLEEVEDEAARQTKPVWIGETTLGMPDRRLVLP